MRCGGGLFFHRGGYGVRTIALRNHAKVCVSEGAPRLGVGCEGMKRFDFSLFFLTPRQYGGKLGILVLRTMVSASRVGET